MLITISQPKLMTSNVLFYPLFCPQPKYSLLSLLSQSTKETRKFSHLRSKNQNLGLIIKIVLPFSNSLFYLLHVDYLFILFIYLICFSPTGFFFQELKKIKEDYSRSNFHLTKVMCSDVYILLSYYFCFVLFPAVLQICG